MEDGSAPDVRRLLSVGDLQALTGLGRTTIYAEIGAGRLVARKVGRRTVFLSEDIERWIASLPAVSKFPARAEE